MANLFLGIDVGTSAVKVAAFSHDGRLVGQVASIPCTLETASLGWAEMTPGKWEAAIRSALRALAEGIDLQGVVAVGLSTIFPALVAMKRNGHALRPAILYCDQRSQEQVNRLREEGLYCEIERVSGNRVAPGSASVTSLLWLRDQEPSLFAAADVFGSANTYLGAWLTGEIGMDASNASLSGLMNARTASWEMGLCERLGLSAKKLPPILGSGQRLGQVRSEAAQATGLPEGTPVAMGAGDTVCAAIGAGVRKPEQAFTTTGTTDTICLCVAEPNADSQLYLCSHALHGRWLSLAPMSCTGGCLAWFRDQLAGSALTYGQLIAEAECAPPGSNGVVFLPYLKGERSPIWDIAVRGAFAGLTTATTRGDLVRAILEATGHAMRHNLETMERAHRVRVEQMTISGKPSSVPLWNQIRADLIGRPVSVSPHQETAVRGAALLGGLAAGMLCPEDWNEQGKGMRYQPDPGNGALYERAHRCYGQLYAAATAVFSPEDGGGW